MYIDRFVPIFRRFLYLKGSFLGGFNVSIALKDACSRGGYFYASWQHKHVLLRHFNSKSSCLRM